MVAAGGNSIMVLLILVFATVTASLEGRKRSEDVSSSQLVNSKSREIDEDMAEQLWINCRLDLIGMKENLDLCFLNKASSSTDEINYKSRSLSKENIHKSARVVLPQSKKMLLDYLKINNLLVPVSGEEVGSKNWCKKFLGSLCSKSDISGQYPGRGLLQRTSNTPAPAPAPKAGAPKINPGPSPDQAPSSSQDPDSEFPAPSPQDPLYSPFYSGSDSQPPSDNTVSASPDSGSNVPADEQSTVQDDKKNSNKTVVVAVIITASVTFLVAALLFFCCTRVCRTGSLSRKNDERPLLSLSLHDHSVGSSHKSFVFGGSFKEEKGGPQAFRNNLSNNKMVSSLDNKIYIESDVHDTSLTRTGAHGLPPLKPPPGQVEPLPPEPPASLKLSPGKQGPSAKPGPSPPGPPPPPPPSVKFSSGKAAPPPPPPALPGKKSGPRPPPPPKGGAPPRPPQSMPLGSKVPRPSPLGPNRSSDAASGGEAEDDAPKTKLKPFFWDKVLASPDTSMVWHEIKSGSFQFNEEMIENLFGYASNEKNKNDRRKESSSQDPTTQYIQIIDSKKAQNLSILLRALNVTAEEICGAIHEGNELPSEFLQTLLKMAPTAEEELKLRLFSGEISQLGPADRFLKALVDIPFAYKRLEALLFMSILQEEVTVTKESFATLEVACKELRNSRLFLKLLEAVLKTGNRMNDGTFRGGAQAFKLDTLLKLSDVKGIDGKITLLHFVVQEIIRSEGIRAGRVARESGSFSSIKTYDLLQDMPNNESEEHYRSIGLQVVSGLGNDLENVKKAANLDAESLTGTVAKLGHALVKTRDFLNSEMENSEEKQGFFETLKSFVKHAEGDTMWLLEEEKRIMALVKSTGDYFHGNAVKDEGLRLFVIVRNFLIILDKVCKEVRESTKRQRS